MTTTFEDRLVSLRGTMEEVEGRAAEYKRCTTIILAALGTMLEIGGARARNTLSDILELCSGLAGDGRSDIPVDHAQFIINEMGATDRYTPPLIDSPQQPAETVETGVMVPGTSTARIVAGNSFRQLVGDFDLFDR